ncbi:enoyl-CoA hydratase/isomerase family protein [Actinokineospora enzanensis]|uniref:enoyl-CoA hydratase/isomerase family protein n=1 Tax=Actinokineospora enzanensis TaxID=155975 RepID=UPI0003748916|nr:enoyl-CoA hydratase-related protein [Actinokineospora enzanensis]
MDQNLILTTDGPVATVTIDRPAKKNALSYEMWRALPDLVRQVAADDTLRALIIQGTESFSAGADITEFGTVRRDVAGARDYAAAIEAATGALTALPKPTIAAVTGFCIGGGCELALACDLRVAAEDARFGITPAKLGIVFALPSTRLLVNAVGPAWAKQILFTADILDARTALRIGLVNELQADPRARAVELAGVMAARSRTTISGAKEIIGRIVDGRHDEDDAVHLLYAASVGGADYAEGVSAFLEKRSPQF